MRSSRRPSRALVHVEQILADPTLAAERTALAQATSAWVVIRLNTRAVGSSDLRLILEDGGRTVLPGGLDRPHFAAFFDPSAEPTPGNPYLQALGGPVAEPGSAEPALPNKLLEVARALGLRVESVA